MRPMELTIQQDLTMFLKCDDGSRSGEFAGCFLNILKKLSIYKLLGHRKPGLSSKNLALRAKSLQIDTAFSVDISFSNSWRKPASAYYQTE